MRDNGRIDTWHVFMAPCEDVHIVLKKLDGDSFIFGGRLAPILVVFSGCPSSSSIVSSFPDGFTRTFRSSMVIV
jgi:hypothetical protein